MPFLSLLPAIKYFGHFQNPDTFVVDIYLLPAVDFAMRGDCCVNNDLLNELVQDTGRQLREISVLANNGQEPVNIDTFAFCFILEGHFVETLVCRLPRMLSSYSLLKIISSSMIRFSLSDSSLRFLASPLLGSFTSISITIWTKQFS